MRNTEFNVEALGAFISSSTSFQALKDLIEDLDLEFEQARKAVKASSDSTSSSAPRTVSIASTNVTLAIFSFVCCVGCYPTINNCLK